ncbi:MAG: DNA topoisomerase IV subunit B, partial [Staphylococcus simulans]|nr:DNA topoisomerase IV subunit B [Staphylococcus simulans]
MNPETRTLIRVNVEDEVRSSKRVTTLMGDKVAPRRDWIERHVQFGMQEDQSILENDEIEILDQEAYDEEEVN